MPRFEEKTDEDIDKIREEVQAKNTISADKKWETVFKEFLEANDMSQDFYDFDVDTLNKWLTKLWFRARQKQMKEEAKEGQPGKRYRAKSLKSMRYAINRVLQKKNKNKFDIISGEQFVPCQRAFDDAIKELKKLGLGYVVSHTEILPEGKINVLSNSFVCKIALSDPTGKKHNNKQLELTM